MRPIPVVFNIWKLKIHTYGIGLAITFWFAVRYYERRVRRAGYPYQWITGVFLWVVVASIVGARGVHVLANLSGPYPASPDYLHHPSQILQIWNGGLSSFGGLLGGVPTGVILARRRCPQLKTLLALDLVAPVLMASWALGRLLGPQLMVNGGGHPTHQWFGMQYATGNPAQPFTPKELPVPIFQAIECFIIYLILIWVERRFRSRPNGFVLAAAMALWGLSRFAEQHLWLSDQASHLGGILVQAAGLTLFAAGLLVMALLWRRHTRALAAGGDGAGAGAKDDGESTDGGSADAKPSEPAEPSEGDEDEGDEDEGDEDEVDDDGALVTAGPGGGEDRSPSGADGADGVDDD